MQGKIRSLNILPVALFFAFAVYMMPGLAGNAFAKEASAEQVFAEQAFAKEVMAAEDDAEGEGEPEIEWSQDVFYKDFEGNPLKGPVSGAPAPELGENSMASPPISGWHFRLQMSLTPSWWVGTILDKSHF